MMHSAVATRYANALADVVTAPSSGLSPETATAELHAFDSVLKESPDLTHVLLTPAIPPGRKRAVAGRIANALKISRISRNFLFVLIDKRRIAWLREIIQSFETIADERMGFARAEVVSALPLNEGQRQALSQQLERVSGRRIRARFGVDDSLIGGVVARIGSTVYDGSVRGQLATLERRLSTEKPIGRNYGSNTSG
jgi:F-type H+-transporting ATPase subunit delta